MESEWNHTLSVWNEGFGIFHHRESYQHSEVDLRSLRIWTAGILIAVLVNRELDDPHSDVLMDPVLEFT